MSEITSEMSDLKPAPPAAMPGCVSWLVFGVILSGIALTSFIHYFFQFGASGALTDNAGFGGLVGAVSQVIILGALLGLLARFWTEPRFRSFYQAWLLAAGLSLLLAPAHLLSITAAQARLVVQIILLIGGAGAALRLLGRARPAAPASSATLTLPEASSQPAAEALFEAAAHPGRISEPGAPASLDSPLLRWAGALALGLAALAPWAQRGAQGSPLDSLLGWLFALVLGAAAAWLCERYIFLPLRAAPGSRLQDFFLGGLAASGGLASLAAATAFGVGGTQLLLLIALPGLGFALSGLAVLFPGPLRLTTPRQWLDRLGPSAALIGLALAGPLVWIDPDELALVVSASAGDVLGVAFRAAFIGLGLALAAGAAFGLAVALTGGSNLGWLTRPVGRISCLAVLGLTAAGALGIGLLSRPAQARPTFNGERLFVILKDQADLSQAASISDPLAKRQFVYHALVQHANTTQADLRAGLERLGITYTPYYLVNALEVQADPALRLWLDARPEVDRVLDSPHMRPLPAPQPVEGGGDLPPLGMPWNLSLIGADRVWRELGVRGEGVVVGQSDSGVQWDHPELAATYRGAQGGQVDHNYNWFDPWNGTQAPADIGGHGTHTTGTIVGQHTGVAPDATWYACANLARNLGNPALYLDCWQFMLAPFPLHGSAFEDGDPARGANVLNNSWGCPELEGCDINTFLSAAQALRAAGVFVVASAGNDGPACRTLNTPPPVYDETFAVGAIDRQRQLTIFSSIGPVTKDGSGRVKPDVVAPGQDVLSSLPNSSYGTFSGTSMAGPHVVGVVALMWSANPALIGQVDATAQILRDTAQPYPGRLPDCPGASADPSTAVGYGIVDAYAAVKAAQAWTP